MLFPPWCSWGVTSGSLSCACLCCHVSCSCCHVSSLHCFVACLRFSLTPALCDWELALCVTVTCDESPVTGPEGPSGGYTGRRHLQRGSSQGVVTSAVGLGHQVVTSAVGSWSAVVTSAVGLKQVLTSAVGVSGSRLEASRLGSGGGPKRRSWGLRVGDTQGTRGRLCSELDVGHLWVNVRDTQGTGASLCSVLRVWRLRRCPSVGDAWRRLCSGSKVLHLRRGGYPAPEV